MIAWTQPRTEACDRLWEVDALREGTLSNADAVQHRRHALLCKVCRDRFAADERLAELGRALVLPVADPLRVRRMRVSVLRAAACPPPSFIRRWRGAFVFIALACAAVTTALAFRHPPEPPVAVSQPATPVSGVGGAGDSFAATVTAMPGAHWSRRHEAEAEGIRLDVGTVSLHVRKQPAGQHFFIDLPDGEIEVRGTTFEVTVRDGATTSIHVDEGVVVFRRLDRDDVVLQQMDTWHPEDRPAPPALAAATADSRLPAPSRPSPSATSEYEIAVAAYRAREYAAAARKFGAFVVAHPSAPEVEDASFLEASALAHDGRTDAAGAAADRFLTRYTSSFHARDAAVLAARAARDRGDCTHARRVLARWTASPTPEVESALRPCAAE